MHLSGPYLPRASKRVLKYLELWHIWLFTIASLIRFFPFMYLAMLAMKLDGITKNLSQTIKNFPINNANISKLLSLLMHLAIWANRNLRFSFQLLYKLEKLAWTSHLSASHLQRKEPQLFSSLLLLCFVKLILVKFYISLGKLREVNWEQNNSCLPQLLPSACVLCQLHSGQFAIFSGLLWVHILLPFTYLQVQHIVFVLF